MLSGNQNVLSGNLNLKLVARKGNPLSKRMWNPDTVVFIRLYKGGNEIRIGRFLYTTFRDSSLNFNHDHPFHFKLSQKWFY